jgi:hypothetical protein
MIGDGFSPVSPILFILPLKNFFNGKVSGMLRVIKIDHGEPSATDIGDNFPLFQDFMFLNFGDNAVKMNRQAGAFIGQGGGYIFDRFSAIGTIRRRERFRGQLWGYPFKPIIDNSPAYVISEGLGLFFTVPGPIFIVPIPVPKGPSSAISPSAAVVHTSLLSVGYLPVLHSKFWQSVQFLHKDTQYQLSFFANNVFLTTIVDFLAEKYSSLLRKGSGKMSYGFGTNKNNIKTKGHTIIFSMDGEEILSGFYDSALFFFANAEPKILKAISRPRFYLHEYHYFPIQGHQINFAGMKPDIPGNN